MTTFNISAEIETDMDPAVFFPESIKYETENLSVKIMNDLDTSFQDVLMMWREAISADSIAIQFLLYYRILEHLNGSRKKADTYIISKDPNIELRKGQFGEDITLYTYLRDNIHAKTPKFPFMEIEKSLSPLSLLVSNAIKESFPQAI